MDNRRFGKERDDESRRRRNLSQDFRESSSFDRNRDFDLDDGRIQMGGDRDLYGLGTDDYRSSDRDPFFERERWGRSSDSWGTGRNDSSWRRDDDESLWEKAKNFFGVGPKGYKRSDERIREDVCEALYADPYVDASDVEVSVQSGEVTLRGTVGDRRIKRMAEDCAHDVSGVADVRNELRVQSQMSSLIGTDKDAGSIVDATTASRSADKSKGRTTTPH